MNDSKQKVEFINYIQRLLQEGDFASTYKFAFLHALADICVEKETPNGAALHVSFEDIIEKIICLYWQHAKPFAPNSSNVDETILLQNAGKQAKIVTHIYKAHNKGIKSINQLKQDETWNSIYRSTLDTFKKGPLWRLQILSKQEETFLFPHTKGLSHITLNNGISDCFKQFHDLVIGLTQQGWISKISQIPHNKHIVGRGVELNAFLFGSNRQSLSKAVPILKDIQSNNCFYCQKPIKEFPEVDHFIPFARYSNDLAHNFVLSHSTCNNNKRDYLAAPVHRERWYNQNMIDNSEEITNELSPYFVCDIDRLLNVSNWVYQITEQNKAKYWLAINKFI